MVYSARTLALLLAVFITVVVIVIQSLVASSDWKIATVAAIISFSASYISIYLVLEFLIFREIEKIYQILGKDWKKESGDGEGQETGALNSLKRIQKEFYSFASQKQKEIDEIGRAHV